MNQSFPPLSPYFLFNPIQHSSQKNILRQKKYWGAICPAPCPKQLRWWLRPNISANVKVYIGNSDNSVKVYLRAVKLKLWLAVMIVYFAVSLHL